jgi:hypothetical protein
VNTANYFTNHSPSHVNYGVSHTNPSLAKPLELHHLQMYGCVAFIHIPKEKCVKLDAHNEKFIFVEHSN